MNLKVVHWFGEAEVRNELVQGPVPVPYLHHHISLTDRRAVVQALHDLVIVRLPHESAEVVVLCKRKEKSKA